MKAIYDFIPPALVVLTLVLTWGALGKFYFEIYQPGMAQESGISSLDRIHQQNELNKIILP